MSKRVVVPWVLVALLAAGVVILAFRGCGKGPVAVVNAVKITESEFNARLQKMSGAQILNDMIFREMLRQAAADEGIQIPQEQIDAELAKLKSQFPSPTEFARALSRSGKTEDDLRAEITDRLRQAALQTKGVSVTEAEARAYLDKHRSQWDQPELYHFLEIVSNSRKDAEEALAKAKQPGADFQTLARSLSVSQLTRPSGGNYGPVPISWVLPDELRSVLAEMKDGEIRGPIGPAERDAGEGEASQGGRYWVIKLMSRKPAVRASFDDPAVRAQVIEQAKFAKAKSDTALFSELKNKYKVTVLWPEFSFLNEEFKGTEEIPQFGRPGGPGTPPATPPAPAANAPAAAPAPAAANAPAPE